MAVSAVMALSNASADRILEGCKSSQTISTIRRPMAADGMNPSSATAAAPAAEGSDPLQPARAAGTQYARRGDKHCA